MSTDSKHDNLSVNWYESTCLKRNVLLRLTFLLAVNPSSVNRTMTDAITDSHLEFQIAVVGGFPFSLFLDITVHCR
jgi:hypothetical protein